MEVFEGAEKVVSICANVTAGERAAVITDPMRPAVIAESIARAARARGAEVTEIYFDGALLNGELRADIGAKIENAQVVFCVTSKTLAYTSAVAACRKNGGRVIALTEATEATLTRGAIEADFESLTSVIAYVKESFDRARDALVTAPGGTSLMLDINGRSASCCTGICHHPGELTGLPAVEVYIAPVEHKTQGIFVADASASRLGLLRETITLRISDGRVYACEGGAEADKLWEILKSTKCANSYVIAEFALGLNPLGELTGSIISDEGLYGTGHFALGSNLAFGGSNSAPVHLDLVYQKPTVFLDGKLFMNDGVLLDFPGKTG